MRTFKKIPDGLTRAARQVAKWWLKDLLARKGFGRQLEFGGANNEFAITVMKTKVLICPCDARAAGATGGAGSAGADGYRPWMPAAAPRPMALSWRFSDG